MGLFKHENKYVLDSSSIIDGRMVYLFERKFIEGKVIVPFVVKSIARKYIGADIDRVISILKKNASVEFIGGAVDGLAEEELVLKIAVKKKARVITTSDELCRQAKLFPALKIIDIRELYRMLMPIFPPRKLITVRILKKGKNAGEGVGYIEGVKVVVEDGARYINQTVNAQVQAMITSDAGNLVLSTLVKHGEERDTAESGHVQREERSHSGGQQRRDDRYRSGGQQRRDNRDHSGGGQQRRDNRDHSGGGQQRRDDRYRGGGQQRRDNRDHSGGGQQHRDNRDHSGGGGQRRDDRDHSSGSGQQRRDDHDHSGGGQQKQEEQPKTDGQTKP